MNNSVFGKTMENLHKQVDVRPVTNEKKPDKLTTKTTYVSSKIFNENLMAVLKVKETLTLNRLAYVGMCILDLSKMLMYDFHYNYIKKKYNNRARLLFTDTDSLTYEIEAEDVYKNFGTTKTCSIIATIWRAHHIIAISIKKSLENSRTKLVASRSLNSLVLSLRCILMSKIMKKGGGTAKGIKKNVIKNNIRREDYKNTLINN